MERRIVTEHGDVEALPLDTVEDALGDVADEATRAPFGLPHLAT